MAFHKNLRGSDLHAPTNELVENNSGSNIDPLSVVTLNGMGNVYPQVILAQPLSKHNFGITNGIISDGTTGYVTTLGFLSNVDTSQWAEGSVLYSTSSGELSTSVYGKPIATVVKQDSMYGQLYVLAAATLGYPNSWDLKGNAGINPTTDFLGTLDNNPIKIRTNNVQVAQFDATGNFSIGAHDPQAPLHIKSYSGYTDSGYRLDTLSMTTASTSYVDLYSVPLNNNQIVKVKINVIARQSDGSERACFIRTGLFYKQSGNVEMQGNVQSDFTMKSNNLFNITYSLNINDITFMIKNALFIDTYWSGHVELEYLSTDT